MEPATLLRRIESIHNNPVRRGRVSQATDGIGSRRAATRARLRCRCGWSRCRAWMVESGTRTRWSQQRSKRLAVPMLSWGFGL